jgi:dienelactone hydrolase
MLHPACWWLARLAALIAAVVWFGATSAAQAQQEFPPPQGKARVIVLLSGHAGPRHDRRAAKAFARLGYDVVLLDSNQFVGRGWLEGSQLAAVGTAIQQAQQMPHALPGRVAVIGLSLGGGVALLYATHLPNLVAGIVVWFPFTRPFQYNPSAVSNVNIPVLMFAGEDDTYNNCCLIGTARGMAAASPSGTPLKVITYPATKHDFIIGGRNYNENSYRDAMQRTAAQLQEYLGR